MMWLSGCEKEFRRKDKPFRHDAGLWQTDRRTDSLWLQIARFLHSIARVKKTVRYVKRYLSIWVLAVRAVIRFYLFLFTESQRNLRLLSCP